MDNKYTQNSLKRKNHKSYNTTPEQEPEQPKQEETKEKEEQQQKPDRLDTILKTVDTENIARMLRFIIHEHELDKFKDTN